MRRRLHFSYIEQALCMLRSVRSELPAVDRGRPYSAKLSPGSSSQRRGRLASAPELQDHVAHVPANMRGPMLLNASKCLDPQAAFHPPHLASEGAKDQSDLTLNEPRSSKALPVHHANVPCIRRPLCCMRLCVPPQCHCRPGLRLAALGWGGWGRDGAAGAAGGAVGSGTAAGSGGSGGSGSIGGAGVAEGAEGAEGTEGAAGTPMRLYQRSHVSGRRTGARDLNAAEIDQMYTEYT